MADLSSALDQTSLIRSRLVVRCSELCSSRSPKTRRHGILILSGITASILNASIKGVLPIELRLVVQYNHKKLSMSSAQALLVSSSPFFSSCRMVWLVTSTSLFVWGCATEVNLCSIFNSSHNFLNLLP